MVEVIETVSIPTDDGYALAFELGIWRYKQSLAFNTGYRFIWYKDGNKLPHRGQARIPIDLERGFPMIEAKLKALAEIEGWYHTSDQGPIVLGRNQISASNIDRSTFKIPAQAVNE